MKKNSRLLVATLGLCLTAGMLFSNGSTAEAGLTDNCLSSLSGGVASVIEPSSYSASDLIIETAEKLNLTLDTEPEEEEDIRDYELVMVNVKGTLNVRTGPGEKYPRVGMFYKGGGGRVLDHQDGWTKVQSGNVIGWASDEYLLFGEEAEAMANDIGKLIATINTESLRVRQEASITSKVLGILPQGEMIGVEEEQDEWVKVTYEGQEGYLCKEFVTLSFKIGVAQTLEEIKKNEKAEYEASRYKKYGAVETDEEILKLLAAIIHCEAGGEPYEGQVAVGAVVMNRVRSSAFPNTIREVIYSPGQFTPAMTGKLDRLLESGKIYESCYKAAAEALSGVSNVGDLLFFRTLNGRSGLVIGHHVFF